MGRTERRNFMALDEAYDYFRHLENGTEKPHLYKLCRALRTVDRAVESSSESVRVGTQLSVEAWSQVRDGLFNWLVSSFPGYFVVYADGQEMPTESGSEWPEQGRLEFYPERGQRKEDNYHAWLERIDPRILMILRWCFAENRQYVTTSDFAFDSEQVEEAEDESVPQVDSLFELCHKEAHRGKKRAHQKWWQLYWEVDSCADKNQKHELRRQMEQLQSVWGRPS